MPVLCFLYKYFKCQFSRTKKKFDIAITGTVHLAKKQNTFNPTYMIIYSRLHCFINFVILILLWRGCISVDKIKTSIRAQT